MIESYNYMYFNFDLIWNVFCNIHVHLHFKSYIRDDMLTRSYITASENLKSFFSTCKEGSARVIKISITDGKANFDGRAQVKTKLILNLSSNKIRTNYTERKILKKHKIIFIVTLNRNVYRQLLDECKYIFFYWRKLLKTETVYEILK